jgi:hypothetical protein
MLRLVRLTSIRAALTSPSAIHARQHHASQLCATPALEHNAAHRPHPDLGEIFALRFRRCEVGELPIRRCSSSGPGVCCRFGARGPSCKCAPSAGRTLDDMNRDEQSVSARATITSRNKLRRVAPLMAPLGLGPACAQTRGMVVGVDPDYARILAFLSSASTRHNNPSLASVHGSCAPSSPTHHHLACVVRTGSSVYLRCLCLPLAAVRFLGSARNSTARFCITLACPTQDQPASPHISCSASTITARRITHLASSAPGTNLLAWPQLFSFAFTARLHRLLLPAAFWLRSEASTGQGILDEAPSSANLHQAQQRLICTPNQALPRDTTQ